jgi:hypothetical protein
MQSLVIPGELDAHTSEARAFLHASREARIELLKPLLEKNDDDKRNMAGAIDFLSALERVLAENPQKFTRGIPAIYRARAYITDRGALMKPLLEQVALLVESV